MQIIVSFKKLMGSGLQHGYCGSAAASDLCMLVRLPCVSGKKKKKIPNAADATNARKIKPVLKPKLCTIEPAMTWLSRCAKAYCSTEGTERKVESAASLSKVSNHKDRNHTKYS